MKILPQIVTVVVIVITVAVGAYLLLNATAEQPSSESPQLPPRSVVKKDIPTAEPKPVSLSIPAGEAGTLEHESGARIEIPSGAVEESVTVSITEVESPQSDLPHGVQMGKVFDISIGQVELTRPVTVYIPYEPQVGTTAEDVIALHWDEDREGWEALEGEVDESRSEIRVRVSELSWFSTIVRDVLSRRYTSDDAEIGFCLTGSSDSRDTMGASVTNHSIKDRMYVEFVTVDPGSGATKRLESDSASLDIDETKDFSVVRDPHNFDWKHAECVLRAGVPLHESTILQPISGSHRLVDWLAPEVHRVGGEFLYIEPPREWFEFKLLHQEDRCAQGDIDTDLEAACELAQRYAPVLRMHHNERFLPRGVEGFVAKARVVDGIDATIVTPGEITSLDELANDSYDQSHYLDVPDDIEDSISHPSTVYWTIRDDSDIEGVEGRLYLQYYLFYYYDHPNPDLLQSVCEGAGVPICLPHEADWELIQLEFIAGNATEAVSPSEVAYSQHGWSEDRSYVDTETQDGHPVAYVALGKHANYFGPGDDASYSMWNVCEEMAADGKASLPVLFPGSDDQAQILSPLTIEESPWISTMCEGAENNDAESDRWTVSIVGDVISDMGGNLLPPALSESIQPCHEASPDIRDCSYDLYFIDEGTPWVEYRGQWGGSKKKISGPDEDTRWNSPHVWSRLCTDRPDVCTRKVLELISTWFWGKPEADAGHTYASVSTGAYYTCGVMTDGSVACWGDNEYGQSSPPSGEFVSVSAGWDHTCGLRPNGTVDCWGWDDYGQSSPPSGEFVSVSAGLLHTCGLRTDGTVDCWGTDGSGQSSPPSGEFVSVSAGWFHNCGLRTDGTVDCWGRDGYGQSSPPSGEFVSASAGGGHNCGVRTDGTVDCWGHDASGQSSPPSGGVSSPSAREVGTNCGLRPNGTVDCWGWDDYGQSSPPSGEFVSVSAGLLHTCGLRTDGTVDCWGTDGSGQSSPPSGEFVSVSAGDWHTCGVRTDGTVDCWGWYGSGQSRPPSGEFVSISTGEYHTCGVRTDGTVDCWGEDEYGESRPPSGEFVSISTGEYHTCGVRTDGTVDCWGWDDDGQSRPPSGEFVSVSAGEYHTCGVRTDGTVDCWGLDHHGQSSPPSGEFVSVGAGGGHTCGLRTDGTVDCWGWDEYGQSSPPSGEFVSVSTGGGHTCGVRTDGTVDCWGEDEYGESRPPSGEFVSVSAGPAHTCGVRVDGTVACWGSVAR